MDFGLWSLNFELCTLYFVPRLYWMKTKTKYKVQSTKFKVLSTNFRPKTQFLISKSI